MRAKKVVEGSLSQLQVTVTVGRGEGAYFLFAVDGGGAWATPHSLKRERRC